MTASEPASIDGTLPRSHLRPCLLLLLAEGDNHGYDLLEQARALGLRGAEPGGLYRALRAMERDGLVESWWEPSQTGPARRTYKLTADGRLALHDAVAPLRVVRDLLDGLLDRYAELGARSGRRR